MKTQKYIYPKIAFFLGLMMLTVSSCEREISDQAVEASFPYTADIFTDAPVSLTDEFFISFDPAEGAKTSGFGTDENVFYQGSSSIRIDVPASNDPDGGFIGGIFRDRGQGRNLTNFDALTFWAKGSTTGTIGEIGFGTDFLDDTFPVSRAGIQLTTGWAKYVVPIPDASKLIQEKGMFLFSAGGLDIIDNIPNGNEIGWTFWMDEIRFEKLGTIGQARPMIYNGQEVVEDVFTGSQIGLNGLKQSFQLGTGEVVSVNPSYNYFSFSSSDASVINTDDLKFDVSGNPYFEVLKEGTATISATLNGLPAEGSYTANSLGSFTTAPDPTRPQEDVISIFSDFYTGVTSLNFAAFNDDNVVISTPIANGNQYVSYENLNFVGFGWDGTLDVSGMTHLHLDVQLTSDGAKNFVVELIDFGANNSDDGLQGVTDDSAGGYLVPSNSLVEGEWISVNIPINSFIRSTGGGGFGRPNLNNIGLVGFVSTTLDSFLIDNVYFYK